MTSQTQAENCTYPTLEGLANANATSGTHLSLVKQTNATPPTNMMISKACEDAGDDFGVHKPKDQVESLVFSFLLVFGFVVVFFVTPLRLWGVCGCVFGA